MFWQVKGESTNMVMALAATSIIMFGSQSSLP